MPVVGDSLWCCGKCPSRAWALGCSSREALLHPASHVLQAVMVMLPEAEEYLDVALGFLGFDFC